MLEDCAKATVAKGDRVRKVAGEANASESDRVRQKLLQAAVCQKTAKTRRGVAEDDRMRKTAKEANAVRARLRKRRTPAKAIPRDERC